MKIFEQNLQDLEGYPSLANEILTFAKDCKRFVFLGNLGAGKTTLVQNICAELGVNEAVNSPTFSLINKYVGSYQGKPVEISHLDLYRLKSIEEALDIGIEELLSSNEYLFIEWPELIEQLLPEPLCVIKIERLENENRKVVCRLFE